MHRHIVSSSLVDDGTAATAVKKLPCTSIGFWNREKGIINASGQTGHVRLCLDGLGLRVLEQVRAGKDSYRALGDVWYVVESIDGFKNSWIEIKVGSLDNMALDMVFH